MEFWLFRDNKKLLPTGALSVTVMEFVFIYLMFLCRKSRQLVSFDFADYPQW